MLAREIPIIPVIETINSNTPPGLKKGDRIVVNGNIIDGELMEFSGEMLLKDAL